MSLISRSEQTVTLDRAVSLVVLAHHVVFAAWVAVKLCKKDAKKRGDKLSSLALGLTLLFLTALTLRESSLVMTAFGHACDTSGMFGAICSFIFRCSYWLLNFLRLDNFGDGLRVVNQLVMWGFIVLMVFCFFGQILLAASGMSFTLTYMPEFDYCLLEGTPLALTTVAVDVFFNFTLAVLFYFQARKCYASMTENAALYYNAHKGLVLNITWVLVSSVGVVFNIVSDVIIFSSLVGIVAFWCFMFFHPLLDGWYQNFCGCWWSTPTKINGMENLEEDPEQDDNAAATDVEAGSNVPTETR